MGWFNHQPAPGGLSSKKWVDSNQGSEYQTLAAKESTHAWKEYDLELRSEARKKGWYCRYCRWKVVYLHDFMILYGGFFGMLSWFFGVYPTFLWDFFFCSIFFCCGLEFLWNRVCPSSVCQCRVMRQSWPDFMREEGLCSLHIFTTLELRRAAALSCWCRCIIDHEGEVSCGAKICVSLRVLLRWGILFSPKVCSSFCWGDIQPGYFSRKLLNGSGFKHLMFSGLLGDHPIWLIRWMGWSWQLGN